MSRRLLPSLLFLALLGTLVAGCGSKDESTDTGAATAANCTPEKLDTQKSGTLTVATDDPAFPPYFIDNDPTNGKGFESAVAYAIAKNLGYRRNQVDWTVEPFNNSYAPGPKDFDFDVNQISISPKRAEQVDFSAPYFTNPQAVVALKGTEAAKATSLADLKGAQFGVQIGTTSLDALDEEIQPDSDAKVFNDSNDVVTALKQHQVDAVVVDLYTALYLTSAQVPEATVVGQFQAPGGDRWGALLEKGSPLTACVSKAVEDLRASGDLDKLEKIWLAGAAGARELD
jgi:polar amino acid transport system substrate-binding protein